MQRGTRFITLVQFYLDRRWLEIDEEDGFACLDAATALPGRLIPSFRSLRFFVHDFIEAFLDRDPHFSLNYPRVAAWLRRWKNHDCPDRSTPV